MERAKPTGLSARCGREGVRCRDVSQETSSGLAAEPSVGDVPCAGCAQADRHAGSRGQQMPSLPVSDGQEPQQEEAHMPQHGKISATIITGFLGAGKTTLIRRLIDQAEGRRLAFIINEFGDLGVDGEILKSCGDPDCGGEDVYELANGCICCTVADDFLPVMENILNREERPDHIIIETSGLALPKPLVRAFNWPEIRTRVTVDGVIAVIDGPAFADGQFATDPEAVEAQRRADPMLDHISPLEELFEDQIACADLIVLNKADMIDEAAVQSLTDDLAARARPGVRVLPARHGDIDMAVLIGLDAAVEDDLEARPSHHDGEDDHEHDDFDSFVVEVNEIAAVEPLIARLKDLAVRHDILRIKGFLALQGKPMRLLLQGVGSRFQHYFDRDWQPEEPRHGRLVIIGLHGIDRQAIAGAISEAVSRAAA